MHVRAQRSRFLRSALRILAIAALMLPLAPRPAVTAQAVPNAECPSSVRIAGPTDGSPGTYYSFTATAIGASDLLSFAIDWYQDGVLTVSDPANPSTQELSWATGGVKSVSVNVRAAIQGRTCRVVTSNCDVTISPLPLSDVPLAPYRLAAQLLEEQRAVTPAWANASLRSPWGEESAGAVTPLYRPGIAGPAYYEFKVFGPGDTDHYVGFIIVSTGAHDHPITNWATAGKSPTHRMRQQAWDAGTVADKFWKLDVLSYAAEDKNGVPVAFRGDLPPTVTLPAGWATTPPPVVTTNWVPTLVTGLADAPSGSTPITFTQIITPTVVGEPTFGQWASWATLKSGYVATFQPFLQALAAGAAPEWAALATQSEHGYVLHKGESVTLPLLYPNPSPVPSGPAWDLGLVDVQLQTLAGLAPRLAITAVDDVFYQGVPMTTTVTYDGGTVETLRVMVVSEPSHRVHLPLVIRGGALGAGAGASGQIPAAAPLLPAGVSAAGDVEPQAYTPGTLAADGYTYWYVGGTEAEADALQAWYDQYTVPNSCKSGCGPTAWAMLIAWGDMRADEGTNSAWAGRTGLYRLNGGRGDPATVAPTTLDDGVKNMVEEIRGQVLTFCNALNDSGATQPFTMHQVVNYLNGRSGVNVRTWYLPAGFSLTGADGDAVRSAARNVIQNEGDWRRPTVIGTGFFSHYPLAYGYRSKTQQTCTTQWYCPTGLPGQCRWVTSCTSYQFKGFYVNQGWGDGTGEWVSTDIFFNGRLTPHVSGANDIGFYRSSDDRYYFDTDHDLSDQFSQKYAAGTLPYAVRPVVGDFDRDGVVDDLGHYVYSFWDSAKRYDWYLDYEANASVERTLDAWTTGTYGNDGWPFALDYDRDGFVDDIGVYYPSYLTGAGICYSTDMDGTKMCTGYAGVSDYLVPVTGDFDRDGFHDDIGFYSRSLRQWAFDMDHDGDYDGGAVAWPPTGSTGAEALPIAGDLDQDGVADDIGLFDPGYQKWWFDYNHNGSTDDSGTGWGRAGDLPFVGNFWNN